MESPTLFHTQRNIPGQKPHMAHLPPILDKSNLQYFWYLVSRGDLTRFVPFAASTMCTTVKANDVIISNILRLCYCCFHQHFATVVQMRANQTSLTSIILETKMTDLLPPARARRTLLLTVFVRSLLYSSLF